MSRAKQREQRRLKDREIRNGIRRPSQEEKLDLFDFCGIKDPTPYEAVKNMIRRGESAARSRTVKVAVAMA